MRVKYSYHIHHYPPAYPSVNEGDEPFNRYLHHTPHVVVSHENGDLLELLRCLESNSNLRDEDGKLESYITEIKIEVLP